MGHAILYKNQQTNFITGKTTYGKHFDHKISFKKNHYLKLDMKISVHNMRLVDANYLKHKNVCIAVAHI